MEAEHISNLIPAVKSGLATPELTQPKTSEETALERAYWSTAISRANLEELKQVLRRVMVMVGLRGINFPNEKEKAVLISHIIKNYGGIRIEEIPLAFEMAITGKLGIDDTNCYENFSCAYFSKIMNAYKLWSAQAVEHLKIDKVPPQRIFTEQELENSQREDAERQYQLFLKGYELNGVEINKVILEKDGLMKPDENVIDFFNDKFNAGFKNIYTKH